LNRKLAAALASSTTDWNNVLKLQRFTSLLTALLVATGLTVAVAPASPAHAAWSDCTSGHNCFWDLHNGSGTPYQSTPVGHMVCQTLPTAQRNKASSIKNNKSGTRIWYYAYTNCQGAPVAARDFPLQYSLFVPHEGNNNIESYLTCFFSVEDCYSHD
jgi:hypothetical protein